MIIPPNACTGHEAIIGHQELSDAIGLYGVFQYVVESCQFLLGKGLW